MGVQKLPLPLGPTLMCLCGSRGQDRQNMGGNETTEVTEVQLGEKLFMQATCKCAPATDTACVKW